jgi:hypothetical protein
MVSGNFGNVLGSWVFPSCSVMSLPKVSAYKYSEYRMFVSIGFTGTTV